MLYIVQMCFAGANCNKVPSIFEQIWSFCPLITSCFPCTFIVYCQQDLSIITDINAHWCIIANQVKPPSTFDKDQVKKFAILEVGEDMNPSRTGTDITRTREAVSGSFLLILSHFEWVKLFVWDSGLHLLASHETI